MSDADMAGQVARLDAELGAEFDVEVDALRVVERD